MSALLTPAADYDAVADAREKLETVAGLIQDAEAVRGVAYETARSLAADYYEHAAGLAKEAALALQTEAGRQQRLAEEAARAQGLDQCLLCKQWLPQDQLVRRSSSSDEVRASHWMSCQACGGPAEEALVEQRRTAPDAPGGAAGAESAR